MMAITHNITGENSLPKAGSGIRLNLLYHEIATGGPAPFAAGARFDSHRLVGRLSRETRPPVEWIRHKPESLPRSTFRSRISNVECHKKANGIG
jgi:hypothetical protein